ncbi:hypothetical protein LTR47_008349, partial [Exophiala xenobiotica]
VFVFAVNHGRGASSITIFSHTIGTNILEFVKDVKHKKLKTPNAVTADGPLSFFITNDHYYYAGWRRTLEDKWGPWTWASHVVHCDASGPSIRCRQVSGPHQFANGILLTENGKTLLVNDLSEGTTTIYDVNPDTKDLILEKKIRLGASPDNLSEIPTTGDIIVPVFPNAETLMKRGFGPGVLDYHIPAEASILRLDRARGYEPTLLFWDNGMSMSMLTGAAVDPYRKKLLAGGVFSKYFLVCDLSKDTTGLVGNEASGATK